MLKKIQSLLAAAIIFLAPAHFFLKLAEQQGFVNGLRVDYLIPKIFIVDILILAYIFLSLLNFRGKEKLPEFKNTVRSHPVVFAALVLSLVSIVAAAILAAPVSGGWYVLQAIVLLLFAVFLRPNHHDASHLASAASLAVIFQSIVGIAQFVRQQSLIGYQLLGEPNFANSIGLAKTSIQGSELILPYGTTPHPNVLGGFLAVYILAILGNLLEKREQGLLRKLLYVLAVISGSITLILTFSISAWAIIMIGSLLLIKKLRGKLGTWVSRRKITIGLIILAVMILMPVALNLASRFYQPSGDSIIRRDYLNRAAAAMFLDNHWLGVGLNSYTRQVERYSSNREVVRFVQPAHHLGLLWLAETGLVGIIFACSVIYLLKKNGSGKVVAGSVLLLLPALVLDHYLISMHQGILLAVIVSRLLMPNWLEQNRPAQN